MVGRMETIPVFFSPLMVAPSEGYSPSAAKPGPVVASWKRLGIPLRFLVPQPATEEELSAVHDRAFVRNVLACRQANGFGTRSPAVASSLLWTSGAMRSAAIHAWKEGGVAVAPCSGFHHAGHADPSGFCTFNGLMVTAAALRAQGARRVGIVDCDMHYGDGTDAIIDVLDAAGWVRHFTAGATFHRPAQAPRFFRELPEVLRGMADCDVVLYQAGADPHVDDPLGGWLTTEELHLRDQVVFRTLKELEVPVAWNLAGGYQRAPDGSIPEVLRIHDNTLRACAAVHLQRAARHGVV
jgi:acetoin utilization deacetylase AcuC-like enzyme